MLAALSQQQHLMGKNAAKHNPCFKGLSPAFLAQKSSTWDWVLMPPVIKRTPKAGEELNYWYNPAGLHFT